MDSIRTHCYATYETEAQAVAMRELLDGAEWPPNGRRLQADFATEEEAAAAAAGKKQQPRQRAAPREAPRQAARPEPVKPPVARKPAKKLEDVFKKTATKPCLYWVEAEKPTKP
eukprot:TRINITY_DN8499_c0_g4_i1.p1 TRINITY_DN8499_c0_g4~~TRINITY_DN8499_c0_g4_i1.p1  ORF type:complete len:114 (+),score=36.59 TRINITY_DN8499_c0_g4_i1:253-594(+)